MHVLINGWFWDRPATGSGQYLHRLLGRLPRQSGPHRFTLLLPSRDGRRTTDDGRPVAFQRLPPSPLPRFPRHLAKLYWEQVTVPLAARRLGADVLFVPYWAAPFWQPVPTVVTVHDLIPLLLPEYRGGLLNRLYTRLVSITARRCRAVLTVSHASARDIGEHLKIPGGRVFAVYHGPNAEAWGRGDVERLARVQEKYGLPEQYFLYLGGFDVRKNVAGTLRAYQCYLEKGGDVAVQLVIAGKLPARGSEFFPDPRRIAAELGVLDQVHFIGWVDEIDKPALYAGAIAYLFPSRYEGFGMMVLEAMAAGCPVITSAE